jgi:hypothetical protein
MAFAQLTYRESLKDIETCLGSVGSKLYHMDFRSTIARSILPMPMSLGTGGSMDLADFAQTLIAIARPLYRCWRQL